MTWALPQVDEDLCTLCGLCVEACSCGAVTMGEQGPIFTCPDGVCPHDSASLEVVNCWCRCEEVCPTGAISCAFEIVMEEDQGEDQGNDALADSLRTAQEGGRTCLAN